MNQNNKKAGQIIILLLVAVFAFWWNSLRASVPAPQQFDYQPGAQPSTWSVAPESIPPHLVIPADPAEMPYTVPAGSAIVHGMPTVAEPVPDPARLEMLENVTSVSGVAHPQQVQSAPDFAVQIETLNKNLETAVILVQECAEEKAAGMLNIPPRPVDCSGVVHNLERAKELYGELENRIREYNGGK
jgi:hypothetical protein